MYVIGDVHGCYLTLTSLINRIGKDNEIISVGDLVDKGPDTCKVLDYVQTLPNFKMVLGNHEEKFIEHMEMYLNGIDVSCSIWYNKWGGFESISSYNHIESKREKFRKIREHLDFLKKQPYYIYLEDKKIFITHGFALPYFEKRDEINTDNLVKIEFTCNRLNSIHFDLLNKQNLEYLNSLNVLNIFGHDAHKDVKFKNNYICLDTGCVYNNKLSAYNIISKEIIFEKNKDKIKFKENMRLNL